MQPIEIKIIDSYDATQAEIAYWVHYFERQAALYIDFLNSDDYDALKYRYTDFWNEINLIKQLAKKLRNYGRNKEYKIVTISAFY